MEFETQKQDMKGVKQLVEEITKSIQKVIVGKSDTIELLIISMICRGHILLEDVPGIGKTTLAKSLAQSLGSSFSRIQCTPDLMPNDVLGFNFFNQKNSSFEFRPGPIFNQIVLVDEINRATPRTQSALLESMQEFQVTIDGNTKQLPSPFTIIATQNPIEMEGTFPLPEAQLDRFIMRLSLGYPSKEEENELFSRSDNNFLSEAITPITNSQEIINLQNIHKSVKVTKEIKNYIIKIISATRDEEDIVLGASPRASLDLYKACQAKASVNARNYVIPDDVKELAPYILAHRIGISLNAQIKERTSDQIINKILDSIEIPIDNDYE